MYSQNTKKNFLYFINNKKTIYHTFLDILIDFDFDSTSCENEFRKCMSTLDLDIIFFDIYGFFSLDINTDINLIKFKYNEFKNDLISKNNSNNVFKIFLELIGFDNNIMGINNNSNLNNLNNLNKHIQIKIISSIEKILSNDELKNIYDQYYLDYNINLIQKNQHKPNTNKEKLDLIDKVYSNLFIKSSILNEKCDINKLNDFYTNRKAPYTINESTTTQEQLDEIYNKMNINKYTNNTKTPFLDVNGNEIILSDEIHKHIKQISNISIDHTQMDFLNKIIVQYKINPNYSINLFNYYKYNLINDDFCGKKYNPYYGNVIEYLDFNDFKNNDNLKKKFVDNFDINEFIEWTKSNEKNNMLEKTNDLDLDNMKKKRNLQTDTIKNNIDDKLEYFANREFTLQQIWDECDYSKTFI